jgi:hypothetical protein
VQRELVTRIVDHWTHGSSGKRIPDRKDALAVVRAAERLEDVIEKLSADGPVTTWVTAARSLDRSMTFADARAALAADGGPVLLVFGTGWGLAESITARADAVLEPIRGAGAFNHLSVRAACAIALDRLRAP